MNLKKKHYEFFKTKCQYYLDLYKIDDIVLKFNNIKSSDNFSNAFVETQNNNGISNITLIMQDYISNNKDIYVDLSETAKHEIIHIICSRFEDMAYSRYVTRDDIYAQLEILVRKLTKLLPDK